MARVGGLSGPRRPAALGPLSGSPARSGPAGAPLPRSLRLRPRRDERLQPDPRRRATSPPPRPGWPSAGTALPVRRDRTLVSPLSSRSRVRARLGRVLLARMARTDERQTFESRTTPPAEVACFRLRSLGRHGPLASPWRSTAHCSYSRWARDDFAAFGATPPPPFGGQLALGRPGLRALTLVVSVRAARMPAAAFGGRPGPQRSSGAVHGPAAKGGSPRPPGPPTLRALRRGRGVP